MAKAPAPFEQILDFFTHTGTGQEARAYLKLFRRGSPSRFALLQVPDTLLFAELETLASAVAYIAKLGLAGSSELAENLIEKARVIAVPGGSFGDDKCIRLSFATSEKNIREGVARLAAALE